MQMLGNMIGVAVCWMRLVKVIARDGEWQMKEEGGIREEEIRQASFISK